VVCFNTATGFVDVDVESVEMCAYAFYRRKVLVNVNISSFCMEQNAYLNSTGSCFKRLVCGRLGITRSFVGHR
jgi:hypothetical protein